MTLATLGDLRSAVLSVRTDFVSKFPNFLALAEQRMYYGGDSNPVTQAKIPPLRVRDLEVTSDLTFTDGIADLPDGYLDKRAIVWPGFAAPISYEPPAEFYSQDVLRQGSPYPYSFTVEGSVVKVSPGLSGTAKMLHYQMAPTLDSEGEPTGERMTADSDTNVILQKFPGVYLYGLQIEVYRETRDDNEEAKSLRRYADAVDAANRYTMISRSVGGPMKRRVGFVGV